MLSFLSGQEIDGNIDHNRSLIEQKNPLTERYFDSQKSSFDRSMRYNQAEFVNSSYITGDYNSENEYLVENAKFWRRNIWIGVGSAIILDALGVYFNSQAVKSYDTYNNAKKTDEVNSASKNIDSYSRLRNLSYSLSLVPMGFAVYSMFKEKYYRVDGLLATDAAVSKSQTIENDPIKRKIQIEPIGFIFVMGGKFSMGNHGNEGNINEKPTHSQKVVDFYISKKEITQSIYEAIMQNNPSQVKSTSFPVENVTWYQALEFCNKLSENENLEPCYIIDNEKVTCNWQADGYRLPTETEWEYAARSRGRKDRIFSGTDRAFNLDEYAWYNRSSYYQIQTVGMKLPNELGIYDMTGNVREWCWNSYKDYPITKKKITVIKNSEKYRVVRGGGWGDKYLDCRTSKRFSVEPDKYLPIVCFRIVKNR